MNEHFAALLLAAAAAAAPPPAADVRSLSVSDAVRLAVERAPEIAVVESAAADAAAAAEEAGSPRRPQLYVNSTPGYSTGLPLALAGEVPSAAGASLRMTLYDAGLRGEQLAA